MPVFSQLPKIAQNLQIPGLLTATPGGDPPAPLVVPTPATPRAFLTPQVGSDRVREGESVLLSVGDRISVPREGSLFRVTRGDVTTYFRFDEASGNWMWAKSGAVNTAMTWQRCGDNLFTDTGANHQYQNQLSQALRSLSEPPRHASLPLLLSNAETYRAGSEFLTSRFISASMGQRNVGGQAEEKAFVVRQGGNEVWIRWDRSDSTWKWGTCATNGLDPGPTTWNALSTAPPGTMSAPLRDAVRWATGGLEQIGDHRRRGEALNVSDRDRLFASYLSLNGQENPVNRIRRTWTMPGTPNGFMVGQNRSTGAFEFTTDSGETWQAVTNTSLPFSRSPVDANPASTVNRAERAQQIANHHVRALSTGELPMAREELQRHAWVLQMAERLGGRQMTDSNRNPLISLPVGNGDTLYLRPRVIEGKVQYDYVINNRDSRTVYNPASADHQTSSAVCFGPLARFERSEAVSERANSPAVGQVRTFLQTVARIAPPEGDRPSLATSQSHVNTCLTEIAAGRRGYEVFNNLITNPVEGVRVEYLNNTGDPIPAYRVSVTYVHPAVPVAPGTSGPPIPPRPETRQLDFRYAGVPVTGRPGQFRFQWQWSVPTQDSGTRTWTTIGDNLTGNTQANGGWWKTDTFPSASFFNNVGNYLLSGAPR